MNKRGHGPLGFFQPTPHSLRRNGAQIGTRDVANCPWSVRMGTHQESDVGDTLEHWFSKGGPPPAITAPPETFQKFTWHDAIDSVFKRCLAVQDLKRVVFFILKSDLEIDERD